MNTTRTKLRTVQLTNARALVRSSGFIVLALASAVAAIGYVLPAHSVHAGDSFHSNFADGGPVPLLVTGFVLAMQLVLRRFRLGAGMIAGLISAAGAIGTVAPVLLAHLFQTPQTTYGEDVFAIGVLGMFFAGAAMIIAEPVVYVLERRRIVRASMPAPLPMAVAVTS